MSILPAQTVWWIEFQIHLYLQQNMQANRLMHAAKRPPPPKPKNSQECTFLFCIPIPPLHQTINFTTPGTCPVFAKHWLELQENSWRLLQSYHLFPNASSFLCCWHKESYWREKGPILIKQMYRQAKKYGTAPRIPSVLVLLNEVLNGWHVPGLSALQGLMSS